MDRVPAKPRKFPKQERSKLLFDSIKQACLQTIESEGIENLSIVRLAEVTGISVGSFYQYFPNVEAVVYELYCDEQPPDHVIIEHISHIVESATSLEDALSRLINYGISYHRQRLELNTDFYQLYHAHYGIIGRMRHSDIYTQILSLFRNMLNRYKDSCGIEHIDIKSFLLIEVMETALHQALDRHPEFLYCDEFEQIVLKTCLGVIDSSQR